MKSGRVLLVCCAAAAICVPAAWATFNQSGNFTLSGRLGVGTDSPNAASLVHVYRDSTASTRFRLSNSEGDCDFSTDNGAFQIFAGNSQRILVWPPSRNSGKVTIGQFAESPVDLEVYGGIQSRSNIYATGDISAKVVEIRGGADIVEGFDVHAPTGLKPIPGMVVSIDSADSQALAVSVEPNDRKVAGIISGAGNLKPAIHMGEFSEGQLPVALTGRVWCFADAGFGAIEAGDSLTTSATPGYAMKVVDSLASQGAIIGKAMTPLAAGEKGLVLVLVNLH